MKKFILIAVITLGALVTYGPMAQAADAGGKTAKTKRGGRQNQVELMKTELSLTDKQVVELKPVLEEQQKKMREMFQDRNTPREERRAKMQKLQEETNTKLKTILTSEQMEKWQKLQQERRKKRSKQ